MTAMNFVQLQNRHFGMFILLSVLFLAGQGRADDFTSNGVMKLWLDANDTATVTVDADNRVTAWGDKSGNGYSATGSANDSVKLLTDANLNNKSAVSFTAAQPGLNISGGIDVTGARSIFIAYNNQSSAGFNSEIIGTATGAMIDTAIGRTYSGHGDGIRFRNGNSNGHPFPSDFPNGGALLTATQSLDTSTNTGTLNAALSQGTTVSTGTVDSTNAFLWTMKDTLGIGWGKFEGRAFTGNLSEMLVFNRVLDAKESAVVSTYLSDKYGMANTAAADTYLWNTSVDSGVWTADTSWAYGSKPSGPSAVWFSNPDTATARAIAVDLTGASLTAAAGETWTFDVDANTTATLSNGGISGAGALAKTGAGTLTLTAASSYTGTTTVDGGTLKFEKPSGSGTWYLYTSEFKINNGATLQFIKDTGANDQIWFQTAAGNKFTFDSNGGGTIDTGSGFNMVIDKATTVTTNGGAKNWITGASGFNLNANSTFTFDVAAGTDASGEDLEVSTRLWNGNDSLVKTGAGTLVLSGANTYTKSTTIDGGKLSIRINQNSNLDITTSEFKINNGSTLQFLRGTGTSNQIWFQMTDGNQFTFDSNGGGTIDTGSNLNLVLAKATTFTTNGGAKNVITGSSGFNMHVSDAITFDVAKGTDAGGVDLDVSAPLWNNGGTVVKTGAGTMVLSGANTYTKGTTISEGKLIITGNTASSSFDIASGATLEIAKYQTLSRTFSGTGTLKLTGNGTSVSHFNISGATIADFSGLTRIEGARVHVQNTTKTFPGKVAVSNNGQLYVQDGTVDAALTIAGIGTHEVEGDLGAVRLQNGTLNGSITLSDNASMMAYAGTGTVNSTIDLAGHTLSISQGNVDSNRRNFALNGIISDSSEGKTGMLVLDLNKTTTINGANTYSGGTTLKQGTVIFSNDSAFGTGLITLKGGNFQQSGARTLANDITVTGTVAIALGSGADMRLNGNLSGNGIINRSGNNTLWLSGDSSAFSGTLNANEGNTYLHKTTAGSASATWNIASTVSACLDNTTAASIDHISLGAIIGSGTLRNDRAGLVIYDIGGLNLSGAAAPTFSGTITDGYNGTIGLNKVGTGTQILSGTLSYSGPTTISVGNLELAPNANAYNLNQLTIAKDASLVLDIAGDTDFAKIHLDDVPTYDAAGFLDLAFVGGYTPSSTSQSYNLIGGALGTEDLNLTDWLLPNLRYEWGLNWYAGTNSLILQRDANAIPEPSTCILLLLGAFGLIRLRRKNASR